ncbi:hypothetical protein RHMOL_Rhmol13G0009700 [Rhododendron molle]|uniref:Uncharacterized protein n=1 Tax=Rhododendron molle TaxID=49168 RepID=A0ACC0L1Q2_RHOML|nr:hypothetical protein RHMOL_Rhmol13G0009700 [Rhododendron molle]
MEASILILLILGPLVVCYAGNPPFLGKGLTFPSLPGTPSRPSVNLINSPLVKDPAERIQWTELCRRAFWRTKFTPLPPYPAFTNMIELLPKPYISERNGDNPPQNKTPTRYRGKDLKGDSKQHENCNPGPRGYYTPLKGTSNGRKTLTKASGKVVEEEEKDPLSNAQGVNLLWLSRIANSNLQRKKENKNNRGPLPTGLENEADVNIEDTDMELDFNENMEDEPHGYPDGSDNPACARNVNSKSPPWSVGTD